LTYSYNAPVAMTTRYHVVVNAYSLLSSPIATGLARSAAHEFRVPSVESEVRSPLLLQNVIDIIIQR